MDTKLTSKQQYELETGKPAEIIIRYDSPEYCIWYIKKRLNKVVEDGCANGQHDFQYEPDMKIVMSLHPITCDQVSWLMDIFNRYLPRDSHPAVSRERTMKQYGVLYEVMEIAGLRFEDDAARWNGTPNEARKYKAEI